MQRLLLSLTCAVFAACSATGKLNKEGSYITAKPKLDAEHTAYLLNQASMQCLGTNTTSQKTGDNSWLVTFPLRGSIYGDAMFAIEITDQEARIAPFNATSNKLRRDCGLIAEWIEVGEVTTCDPTEAHLKRWP